MTHLKIGDTAPAFSVPDDTGNTVKLTDFKGQKLVIYFYPKDDTPGCTTESCAFRDNFQDFKKLNVAIVGISKDSPASHVKFKKKFDLNFPLLSDENGTMCEDYGVWGEKSMYGKKYMGIERSTFLIDEHGKIAALWAKVSVDGHVEDVRAALNKKAA
jgi:thioredoxin-dependent peroxiredoxin